MPTGDAILLFSFVFINVALMIGGFAVKKVAVVLSSAVGWFLLGVFAYTRVVLLWDVYYSMFAFCFLLFLVSGLGSVAMWWGGRYKAEEEEEEDEGTAWRRERSQWLAGRSGHPVLRLPPPKPSNYSKTGIHEEKK